MPHGMPRCEGLLGSCWRKGWEGCTGCSHDSWTGLGGTTGKQVRGTYALVLHWVVQEGGQPALSWIAPQSPGKHLAMSRDVFWLSRFGEGEATGCWAFYYVQDSLHNREPSSLKWQQCWDWETALRKARLGYIWVHVGSDVRLMGRIIPLGELDMDKICLKYSILAAYENTDFTSPIMKDLKGQNLE